MNRRYILFCIVILSATQVWGMNPSPVTHNYLEIKELHHHYHSTKQDNVPEGDMNWKQKTTYYLEHGGWHVVEQLPIMIINIGLQKLVHYLESGSAEDASFMHDANDAGKQEMFRSLLKGQLVAIAEDEEELTKQVASCSNKAEKETLQKILEEKRKHRTMLTKEYHLFAHQHADNTLHFVHKYKN